MQSPKTTGLRRAGLAIGALALAVLPAMAQAEWKPTRNIEFIVPAGTGGGADQMARMIQGVVEKNNLIDRSVVVINKSGGAGAEGFRSEERRVGKECRSGGSADE